MDTIKTLLAHQQINVNIQDIKKNSAFFIASHYNHYESVFLLLQDARVDVNMCDQHGWSPFMKACYNGNTLVVQLLLSFGRRVNMKNDHGQNALDIAKELDKFSVVNILEAYQKNQEETQKTIRGHLNIKGIIYKIFKI